MYKNFLKIGILLILLALGFGFAKLYQPESKTLKIYKNALTDYNNANYSNSYFLFSKVGYLSPLKPYALYRQAMSARALGDKASELNRYQILINLYPTSKLASESRYKAAQLLIDDNPDIAYKYFDKVLKSDLNEDYKIATQYYMARILASKIKYSKKISRRNKVADIEKSFRAYLDHAPDGRLAVNVANNWMKFNPNMTSKDSVLVAKVYYLANMPQQASLALENASKDDAWAIKAVNSYCLKDYESANSLVEDGVSKYSNLVSRFDYKKAVDGYVDNTIKDKKDAVIYLYSVAKDSHKDYLLSLKCGLIPQKDKYACYTSLYQNYPNGEFAQNSLYQMVMLSLKVRDFNNARGLAKEYLHKFGNTQEAAQVAFWLAKMEQQYFHNADFTKFYEDVINKYPDTYYAYRAFWLMQGIKSATINTDLEYKPVLYPYKYPSKKTVLHTLLSVNDYEMVEKYTQDDFIKSWIEYEKGNYPSSMIIARDAMDKLEVKPPKGDLRWRLVYPQNYYKQVKLFADKYNNVDALMMAIVREESSFNPKAQSSVGAIGLMQLMPTTAHEVGKNTGIDFNTSYLFNPELNLRLGNIYYASLRSMLEDKDVSAIAAYNGGVGSVKKWRELLKYNDTDEFVEQIPYEETKNYVIKVFRSYWNYTRIYQH